MAMNIQPLPDTWELVADDILSVVMAEPIACQDARFNYGLRPAHLPEPHRTALQVVYDLYDSGETVHDTTILARAGGKFDLYWLSQRIALYDAMRSVAFLSNVKIGMQEGVRQGTMRLLDIAKTEIAIGKPTGLTLEKLYAVLSGVTVGKQISKETTDQHGAQYRQRLAQAATNGISTGFEWLDRLTDGIQPGKLWWVAGAYKQRKTTFVLNLQLALAVMGESSALLSGEMTKEQVYWQLIAMLMITYMLKHDTYHATFKAKDGHEYPLNWVTGVSLYNAQNRYKYWHPDKIKALEWALDFYESLPLRVYDSSDDGGGLNDLDSIRRVIGYDRTRYKASIYFGDYIQLFDAPGNGMYEKESLKARTLQQMSRKDALTMIWTAQKNEESIKYAMKTESPGVSGGGAVPQTADYLLIPSYKQGDDPDERKLGLQMKLSRYSASGSQTVTEFDIHPGSGLILGQQWLEKVTA